MIRKLTTAFVLSGIALSTSSLAETPRHLKVIISGGFAQAYAAVLPEFEQQTGIKVETGSGASEGIGPKTIRYQLAHGVTADVVILSREGLHKLSEDGRIRPGSAVGLATAPLGAAVRSGEPKPDITTNGSFRQAVIHAGQVVMPGSTSGQFVRDNVFPKLDLPKSVTLTLVARGTESAEYLKAGKANLSIGPTSELVNVPGIDFVGALPNDYQIVQTFTAGIVDNAQNSEDAKRLIEFLSNDSVNLLKAIRMSGMEPAKLQ